MSSIYDSHLPGTTFGGKFMKSEYEYELLPEFELDGKITNQPPHPPSNKENSGDPAAGWEADNESFTKRLAELHLKNHYRINDTIQRIHNCCIDPDFFTRRCEFVTAKNVKGVVLWSPFNKQASIVVCIKGQKLLCWYDYYTRSGQLHLRHKKCLNKKTPCTS